MKNKICSKCKNKKTLTNFYNCKTKGYYTHCKSCHSKITTKWYIDNKENHDKRNKEWYVMNKTQHNKNSKQWYKLNPEKALNTYISRKYKINLKDFNRILKKQNFSCAICEISTSKLNIRISIDHCHKTNKVRGLLCGKCNFGIGYFEENINFLKRAIKYLKKHSKGEIICELV